MDFFSYWRVIVFAGDDPKLVALEVKVLQYFILAAFGVDG